MTAGNMLIAHGGGPTPVINASLHGAVDEAKRHGQIGTIYGARFGAEGILRGDLIDLGCIPGETLAKLSRTPSSALGSCRRKLVEGDYPALLETFRRFDIRYFFYNGGNDSMDTCDKIHRMAERAGYEMRVIGIPKTIDNDLAETDHCPGFGSAARYAAVSAAELAMDAAGLPIHVIVMEMMGRNAGWITAATALYADTMPCAHLVYLPERPLSRAQFVRDVQAAWAKGKGVLVTVSEGLRDETGKPYGDSGVRDGFGHIIPGGTAQALVEVLLTQTECKARAEKPGLLGRVSIPLQSATDRDEAYAAGAFAVRSAVEGHAGFMVALHAARTPKYACSLLLVPLASVANVERGFPLEWIGSDGCSVTRAFRDYCLPLLGAQPAPDFVHLY